MTLTSGRLDEVSSGQTRYERASSDLLARQRSRLQNDSAVVTRQLPPSVSWSQTPSTMLDSLDFASFRSIDYSPDVRPEIVPPALLDEAHVLHHVYLCSSIFYGLLGFLCF